MKKNDILRHAAQHKMPDIEQVRKECIEELHTTHSSKRYPAYFAAIAVVTVVVLCMCITPVRSFAADMIEHIQALIDVNMIRHVIWCIENIAVDCLFGKVVKR